MCRTDARRRRVRQCVRWPLLALAGRSTACRCSPCAAAPPDARSAGESSGSTATSARPSTRTRRPSTRRSASSRRRWSWPRLGARAPQLRPGAAARRPDRPRASPSSRRRQKQDPAHPPHLVQPRHRLQAGLAGRARPSAQFERWSSSSPTSRSRTTTSAFSTSSRSGRPRPLREFERAAAARSEPGGPHFQLANAYRHAGRAADVAARDASLPGASSGGRPVPPSPRIWSGATTPRLYDPVGPARWPRRRRPAAPALRGPAAARARSTGDAPGLLVLDVDGDGAPTCWPGRPPASRLLRNGVTAVEAQGSRRSPASCRSRSGDFDNDGLPGPVRGRRGWPALRQNTAARLAARRLPCRRVVSKAVWLDYDHDYDLDLLLAGDGRRLLRNNGPAGFSDETADFPFVHGARAVGRGACST